MPQSDLDGYEYLATSQFADKQNRIASEFKLTRFILHGIFGGVCRRRARRTGASVRLAPCRRCGPGTARFSVMLLGNQ
jgi:hypothetical protein